MAHIGDLLETLADNLPQPSPAVWQETRHLCQGELKLHLTLLCQVVVPELAKRTQGKDDYEALLCCLSGDFENDLSRLTDLDDMFSEVIGKHSDSRTYEAFGFALRACFEAVRRLVRWESEVLLPMVERWLADADAEFLLGEIAPRDDRYLRLN
ncbi:MAG: hypothetical protein AAGA87_13545 [Pseudomonadota bacterium]